MAKKFRGVEIVKEIDAALDKGLARFLINTQSKLSASSPVDGPFASVGLLARRANRKTRPENWAEPGASVWR